MTEGQLLAAELSATVYGSLLLATGVALVLGGLILRSRRTLEVPAFGAAILLHGTRALGEIQAVRTASGLPEEVFEYSGAICFYFISAASYLFLDQYWGPGLWKSLRRAWQFHLLFAAAATATDLYAGNPGGFLDASATLVVVYRVILLGNIVTRSLETRREDIYVLYGIGVVLLCTVHDVLVTANVLPWTLEARPVGIVAVMGALGCSILLRARADHRQLGTLSAQLTTAREIQKSLLPPKAMHPTTCRHAVRYIPMDAVGGDLYDFIRIDADRFAVLMADVTGHGIPAALIASMLKTAAAAQSHVADDPGRVVREINRRLHDQLDGYLVTLVYAVVDTRSRQLALCNAGHPAPLLRRRNRASATAIGSAAAAIGVVEDETYAATRIPLESGDRLVFYTDGLTEAESPDGEPFSVDRVRERLAEDRESDVEPWTEKLLESVRRWRGRAELQDDLTVVCLDIP